MLSSIHTFLIFLRWLLWSLLFHSCLVQPIHSTILSSSSTSLQSSSVSSDFQHPIWAGQWCWHCHGKPNRFCLSLCQHWQPHYWHPCNDFTNDISRDESCPVQPSRGLQPPDQLFCIIAALILGPLCTHNAVGRTADYWGGATGGAYSWQQRSEEGKDSRKRRKRRKAWT